MEGHRSTAFLVQALLKFLIDLHINRKCEIAISNYFCTHTHTTSTMAKIQDIDVVVAEILKMMADGPSIARAD